MTLDEAIKRYEKKAKELSDRAYEAWCHSMAERAYECNEYALKYEQLVRWLKELKALKAQNQEHNKGEWINDSGLYKCSQCQTLHTEFWASVVPLERMYAFCPYCGADMKGGTE